MWVLECDRLGPFLVEGDTQGHCFFQEHAAEIDAPLMAAYEGLPKPILSRLGEEQDPVVTELDPRVSRVNLRTGHSPATC